MPLEERKRVRDERIREFENLKELESERKREERKFFCRKERSYGEYEEMKETKRMKKKKRNNW